MPNVVVPLSAYLLTDVDLARGSVDDIGDGKYFRLSQNVPDGFVTDLQTDLNALEFTEAGQPDGAFGRNTKSAVAAFQDMAKITSSGMVDRATRVALRDWLESGHSKSDPPGEDISAADGITFIQPRIGHFSQGNPLWASKVLGRNRTIVRSGCAITCVAVILRHHGRDVDPGSLDAFLDANDGYVGGSVKWGIAGTCAEGDSDAVVYGRLEGTAEELRPVIYDRLEAQRPTMVRVDYGSDAGLKYNHFVLAVGRTEDGNIVMNDPATRHGDGYLAPQPDNIIELTPRKQGYEIVQLDWFD